MKAPNRSRNVAVAAMAIAILAMTQIGLPATQVTAASQTRGVPGPTAAGKRVDLRQLPPIKGDTPQQVREIPQLYPVDANSFGQLKAAANQAAASKGHKPGSGTITSGPAPTFPTLDFTQTGGWNPPDAGLAVGPNSILVALNEALGIYSKPTTTNPFALNTLVMFSSKDLFNTTDSVFDPRALYDAYNKRFVLLAVSQNGANKTSYYQLAVSDTSDPPTVWTTFSIPAVTGSDGSAAWADFPGLGMDANYIYITSNQFTFSNNTFQYARILAIPKKSVYCTSGTCTATSTSYPDLLNPDGSTAFTVQPANQPFATSSSTTPMYFVNALWSTGSQLVVRSIDSSGKLSGSASVDVAPYTLPADAPQPGHRARKIDTGDDRLLGATMDANGVIYTANTTGATNAAPNPYANAQWYAITPGSSDGSPTYGATTKAITSPTVAYYYPAVAATSSGAVGVEVSGSGSAQTASAFYIDSTGNATSYAGGVSGYTLSSRWGDYGAAAPDPSNTGKVWVLGEYAKYSNGWGTAVTQVPAP